ncbi:uncharacterized protein LOC134881465 isoform X4 [Eleginops maclovinus]|uniref:uncharacterized protein LOC134881465 isoform X2 n=1 Tax=Eleginops maclovinus TaxID=56733 RepID=UPI003080E16F
MSDELEDSQKEEAKLIYQHFIQAYLSRKDLPEPGCTQSVNGSAEWLKENLGIFSNLASLKELKQINKNFSAKNSLETLSLKQKAELFLDPENGALEDEAVVKNVLTSFIESPDDDEFKDFLKAFAENNKQKNITLIKNPGVRDTILNLTLTALAPELEEYGPEEYETLFQDQLAPVLASLHPGSLAVIPNNISCPSYGAILAALRENVESLPLQLSDSLRSSIKSLKERFTRCSLPDSFTCKKTPVNEKLICAAVDRSHVQETLSVYNSSEALCRFTITEHACAWATRLTASNLVTLMNCTLDSNRTYSTEVWKLLFQKASAELDKALETFATMAPPNSNPSLTHALEALGEVRIANFSQTQLQSDDFVSSWFQTNIRPFLASTTPNFLFCLSTNNFSCETYQTVIKALSSQMASMDRGQQQAVYTHFIQPFLSRNDSSDPGCVSFNRGSKEWFQANLGKFSGFATLRDLQGLNANFSSAELLAVLTPSQLAELTLSSGALNDTDLIDRVFERLHEGDALENVEEFLTQLPANGKGPDLPPDVRDRVMNQTFSIISPQFKHFKEEDWFEWFHILLVPVLQSFSPMMLKSATANISCTNYQVIVRGMSKASRAKPFKTQKDIAKVLLEYLKRSASSINKPVCRQGNQSDAEWLKANLGAFSQNVPYSDLKAFNLSAMAVVDSLSPAQKAELILDPDSGAVEDEAFLREVLMSLTQSPDDEDFEQFLIAFAKTSKQKNITLIKNPGVRDTILNLTLTALAPELEEYGPEEYETLFQDQLAPVLASLHPGSLAVIPNNISCPSYGAILAALRENVESLPLQLSDSLRSSIKSLKERFTRCSLPDSFTCKKTPVNEKLICAAVDRSHVQETLSVYNSSEALCRFTITEHACAWATRLTASNLVTLMNCTLDSNRTYSTEVWKLLFQKASAELDKALETFATMAPPNSNPSLTHALEALGEVRIANFSQTQLQSDDFVSSWFQTNIRPFLASTTPNFLFCLSTNNFSCETYQTVIKALSSQMASMDRGQQQAVYTHFIQPFLSRNDSSDPGCVSFNRGSKEWFQANLGKFSGFATLRDLQGLNANFSSAELLAVLTPSQLAELTLSSGALNDTDLIDRVFERLHEGDALENVEEFLTQLPANGKGPDLPPDVRDRVMNQTFSIISPQFKHFKEEDWFEWFHILLVPVLQSFSPMMLKSATANISCTNYQVIVRGMSKASRAKPFKTQKDIAKVLLEYLKRSASSINKPVCRQGNQSDAEWLKANLGAFSQNVPYSDLKAFNLSAMAVVDSLSPAQKAELILDPDSGAVEDEAFLREVLMSLTQSPDDEDFEQFLIAFAKTSKQKNITLIKNPGVRDTILNLTLTALAPELEEYGPEEYETLFQDQLAPVLASLHPGSLAVIPNNISCPSYGAILAALRENVESLPLQLSDSLRSSIKSLKERFTRCSLPDSFTCKKTPVNEKLICAAVDRSHVQETLSVYNSSEALCRFTITEHACAWATRLTASNLVTLMNCTLDSNRTYSTEVWKLLFQKASAELDKALETFATMAPPNSNPSLTHALEALGEVRIANFSQTQLQSDDFVSSWFQTNIRPFLASTTPNFLFCLSTNNFSCETYQTVIKALSSQMASMDRGQQQAVYTHFIQPFLSRNDSSDPGCVSFNRGSKEWFQANLGKFSGFATLRDLQGLNANFSSAELLAVLTPSQLAELTLSSGALNDTDLIDRVFERLHEGDALENVEEFLTQLPANGKGPDLPPDVRDRVMNQTFSIISPQFKHFKEEDWFEWFHILLVPVLQSFSPMMLKSATANISCTNYQVIVRGMSKASRAKPFKTQKDIAKVLLEYLKRSASSINKPVCRQGNQSDAEWLKANLGAFSQNVPYSDLKAFNLSAMAVVDSLSPAQKAELILDPDSGAVEDEAFLREVLMSLTQSPDDEDFEQFLIAFAKTSKQKNITLIKNPGVRDTILNLTLTALAPELEEYGPEEYETLFQDQLAPVLASLHPGSLAVIPNNISCPSYGAILAALRENVESLPLQLSDSLRSSIKSLKERFTRCSLPDSFTCKKTPVNEKLICAAVDRSHVQETLSVYNSSEALCRFTITEHACAWATRLTASNLVTLMNCTLDSNRTYSTEVWKLLFQKASAELDKALETFATMAPPNSNPSLTHALEALGEVRIANFSQTQLQSDDFVSSWFQTNIRPFLASTTPNFLFCLSTNNFSCETYQTVIKALSSQMASMDRGQQQAVYTHFIQPFLSRNDSSDPGCVSFNRGSKEWFQANLGKFSGFATLRDLQGLNANFSSAELLAVLTPSQLAELTLSSGALNDTDLIDRVFERLHEGDALENVEEFLTQLPANGKGPDLPPDVRDRVMNQTFSIISPQFKHFKEEDWFEWFHILLVPVLQSFSPMMLKSATANISCTNYQVIVRGMSKASRAKPFKTQKDIAKVLLEYLKRSASSINKPVCRQGNQSDAEWLKANLGAFSQNVPYSDLKAFNLSAMAVVDSLSPAQKAELILDPDSGAVEDEAFLREVLMSLTQSPDDEDFEQFLIAFAKTSKQKNITLIKNPGVRDTILNLTLTALAPELEEYGPEEYETLFQDQLAPVLASLHPGSLAVIPNNISCPSYGAILAALRENVESLPLQLSDSLRSSIKSLKERFTRCSLPDSFTCKKTPVNEKLICAAVDRSHVQETLSVYNSSEALCRFTITEHACAWATRLTASNLVTLMNCTLDSNRTYSTEVWKLLFQKASAELDKALETFATMAPPNSNPSLTHALEALGEVRIANFSQTQLQSDDFVSSWFQTNIRPFLASTTPNFLFCLSTNNFSCETYQTVIKALSSQMAFMDRGQQQAVYTHFIQPFLSRNDSSDPGCVSFNRGSKEWLQANLGKFSGFATLRDLQGLNANFSSVEVADLLTFSQLAQLAATPSHLKTTMDVTNIMKVISPVNFGAFFDIVSPAIEAHPANFTVEVKSSFLQAVYDRGNLSSPAINDTEFLLWLRRLSPLLVNLSPSLVTSLFDIGKKRGCYSSEEIITLLDTQRLTLSSSTQREINKNILQSLQVPTPLECYKGGSFYIYLKNTFHGFEFPDLSTFTSLLPPTRESELLSTISTSELHQFLSRPNVIDNESDICVIFNNYKNTAAFLEIEDVPDDVKMMTLPCVWPLALSSNNRDEVNSWFDVRLTKYFRFLTKTLISSNEVQNASCFAFQKLVSVMGNNFTYNNSEFGQADVYTTIRTYLGNGSEARCYNANDAELNSTAWFVNNIGNFVTFATVDDISNFISTSQTDVFWVDQANLELFNNAAITQTVTDYYILNLYQFNPTFNPLKVPGSFLCSPEVPSSAYSSASEADTIQILEEIKKFCNGTEDPEVSAILASNFKTFTMETFANLGSASAGLSSSQITSISSEVVVSSLSTLGSVDTWNQGQANIFIQKIISSHFQLNNGFSLESLGTLVAGVPSGLFENVSATVLFSISQNTVFVNNMIAAPTVIQHVFVQKIISVDRSAAGVVQNVPDAMATEIPSSLLVFSKPVDFSKINKKTWTGEQAAIFFDSLGETDFDTEQLNPTVLQGFTCTTVKKMEKKRVQGLIRSCRPRKGRAKVQLEETQLTCMYNLLNGSLSQDFTEYPSDMLIYLNKDVEGANCRSYFTALGAADFTVSSSVLKKDSKLFSEAQNCLGIRGVTLKRSDVEVLGNMVCTLEGSYIENSDSMILEKLKACKDLSTSQVAAIEKLLLSGKTKYGDVTTWNAKTLVDLGELPLYLTENFWGRFKTKTKKRFLKSFMPKQRKKKVKKSKLKKLFKHISSRKTKRGAGCTVGNITQVTVSDNAFPFGYDLTQFDLCLDIPILKENLDSICQKVDDDDFQTVILRKLNEAYPSGVPEEQVQLLGSVSRVATLNDISKWTITKVDTLAALMKTEDGSLEAAKSKAIITKYLETPGNSLGATELNSIHSNLCSLNITLQNIKPDSISNAKPLNLASCSTEQKKELYEISKTAFLSHSSQSSTYYNLIKPYLGGAPLSDVVELSKQDINMDVNTFQSLDPNVISKLTVPEVAALMRVTVQDLKVFENATAVHTWRNLQLQHELDKLGLGLITSRASPTTATPNSKTTKYPATVKTTKAKATVAATVKPTQAKATVAATVKPTQAKPAETTTPKVTTTTAQGNATSGGAQLAKHPTSMFLAVLLTTVLLQLLQ